MSSVCPVFNLSPRDYDAVLFDLDGVLTRTASVHAAAWKRMFDEFLQQRAAATGTEFIPFDIDSDYRRYVDGKPRQNNFKSMAELPANSDISDRMSRDLKKRGFNFVGSTICYAFMQAVGMVNDHEMDCFRYGELR